jgi:hypothetical protein
LLQNPFECGTGKITTVIVSDAQHTASQALLQTGLKIFFCACNARATKLAKCKMRFIEFA